VARSVDLHQSALSGLRPDHNESHHGRSAKTASCLSDDWRKIAAEEARKMCGLWQISLCALALLLSAGSAAAQSSKEYAMMAKHAWAAFECSSFASVAGDKKEQERLFQYGYENGKEFLAALRENKIEQAHLLDTVQLRFLSVARGPTMDFILGRVYEWAQGSAVKRVSSSEGGKERPEDVQTIIAKIQFQKANCILLGK
jgi:hypothetical protein